MDERRRDPRLAVTWSGRIWTPDEIIVGNTIDVSAHGICLATAPTAALRVGRAYRLELVAEQGEPFVTVGEIRHVSARGVGIRTRDRLPIGSVVVARDAEAS
jgi:hypothetical protein